jgi:hypothetical protein
MNSMLRVPVKVQTACLTAIAVAAGLFGGCATATDVWGVNLANPAMPPYERWLLGTLPAPSSMSRQTYLDLRDLQPPAPTVSGDKEPRRQAFLDGFCDGWRFGVLCSLSGYTQIGGRGGFPGPADDAQRTYSGGFSEGRPLGLQAYRLWVTRTYALPVSPWDEAGNEGKTNTARVSVSNAPPAHATRER